MTGFLEDQSFNFGGLLALPSEQPPLILPLEKWPLVLCGPILRRVDERTVCVWVAVKEACKVDLSVWRGVINTGSGSGLFSGMAEDFSDFAFTLRIGENLHVVAVTITLTGGSMLLPGEVYSYNLTFTKSGGEKQDLKSLGLLEDKFTDDPLQKPHLALGYNQNYLPSFSTCPLELDKLKIAHGSCHKVGKKVTSATAWLDDMIKNTLSDPSERPHQLILTGDQIYADEVPMNLLPALNTVGNMLLGHKLSERDKMEQLPTKFPEQQGVRLWPADLLHFPTGLRDKLMGPYGQTNFTTDAGESHLLSFGEFCAMYIFSWCNALWPTREITTFGGIEPAVDYTEGVLVRPLSRPEIWTIYTGLSDLTEGTKFEDFFDPEKNEELGEKMISFYKSVKEIDEFDDMTNLKEFQYSLPKIQRVLANVPTYMIFDDHEVTDDWNMDRSWYQSVLSAPLGRTVIRNALAAYTIFQDWGNDPLKLQNSGDYATLLMDITNLFPKDEDRPPNAQAVEDIERLFGWDGSEESFSNPPIKWHYSVSGPKHKILVLDARTRRDYYSASRHSPPALLSYGGANTALEQQIPSGPPATGLEVLFVVSSLTVIGPAVIESLFQPMARRYRDLKRTVGNVSQREKDIIGTDPDIEAWPFNPPAFEALLARLESYRRVVILSGDVHFGYSASISYWKKEDQEDHPARIVQFTSSGLKNAWDDDMRGLIRSFSLFQRLIKARARIELLGWHQAPDDVSKILKLPADDIPVPTLLARTRLSPVLIPTTGWPEGTSSFDEDEDNNHKRPDWSWRCVLLSDTRTDDEIPEAVRPEQLEADIDLSDPFTAYSKIVYRHADMVDKISNHGTLVFDNNLGIIKFEYSSVGEDESEKILFVRQELLSIHPEGEPKNVPYAYTIHQAVLDSPRGFLEHRPRIEPTPPTIVSTFPVDGDTGVPITSAIMVTFDEPIDDSTVTISTFLLKNDIGTNIDGRVLLSNDSMTAIFKPIFPLAHSTRHSATITAQVKDRSGNAIKEPQDWSFTTG
jgi:hypothetical protein